MLRNCWGGGVGSVGDDDVLCTCTHVTCYATAGVVGWGGVGWVGDDDVLCTCTHVTCYATAGVVGWGGVGWVGDDDVLWGVCKAFIPKQIKKKLNKKVALCKTHCTKHDCFNGCGAATLWKLA